MKQPLTKRFSAFALVLGVVALLFSTGTASASAAFYAPSLPWHTSASPSVPWTNSMNICFGGSGCGGSGSTITVQTPTAYIASVHVQANDNEGGKHQGTLHVFVDGVLVGAADVLAAGSMLSFPVNRTGSTVTLAAAPHPGAWSDEIRANGILILS